MTEKRAKAKIDFVMSQKAPFFVAEHPDSKTIVGFIYSKARRRPDDHEDESAPLIPEFQYYLSVAQLYVYIAPGYTKRCLGRGLVNRNIRFLQDLRWIPADFGGKGPIEEQKKHGFPCWRNVLVIMPVRGTRRDRRNQPLEETGVSAGPMNEEEQRKVWSSLGFEEAGRLYGSIEEDGVSRDEWIWQKRLS